MNITLSAKISLAHVCNNLLGRPRKALLTSKQLKLFKNVARAKRTSDNSRLTL